MKNPVFFFALLLGSVRLTAQCLSLPACPPPPVVICDSSSNDAQFWREAAWYDAANNLHDLAEVPADLSTQITSGCAGDVQVSYVLFLDLDGNGSRETAISSLALPGTDTVYFNNAFNPNFSGGTPRHFDERPVAENEKYGFVLEKTVQAGIVTARVRWASAAAPGTYVLPQLPAGTHRIEWRFEQNGEVQTCAYSFQVRDCAPPAVFCLNGLSVNIMPTQMIQLWASDFLQYGQDNITPALVLEYGIRRSGTGAGFPVDALGDPADNLVFTCAELGNQPVELWVRDAAGNASYCETYVIVQDNYFNCETAGSTYQFCAKIACSGFTTGVEEVNYELSGTSPAVPPFSIFALSDDNGCYSLNANAFPIASNVKVSASSDDQPLNGVSSYDLVLLSEHIHGTAPFTEPWQWLAADADENGVIDTLDIVNCRALMLGIPNAVVHPGFRFYPIDYAFPAGNPLALPVPEYIELSSLSPGQSVVFAAVKTCDLNCNALPVGVDEVLTGANVGLPQPNPTAAGVVIPLSLPRSADVFIEILDLTGRSLYRSGASREAGDQQLEIPASAFPQAGVYVWRVQAGRESRAGKLLKQ